MKINGNLINNQSKLNIQNEDLATNHKIQEISRIFVKYYFYIRVH